MRRNVMMVTMMAALFGAGGCSAAETVAEKAQTVPGKVLIACYSWGGNTRAAAQQIQQLTGGELFEIKPAKAYPADYRACTEQARREIDAGFRPELAAKVEDIRKYDVIFIGSPNWWGTMAPPVAAFLAAHDLKDKTVIPFFTHGGGGMQRCEAEVKKLCGQSRVLKAATFAGGGMHRPSKELAEWVQSVIDVRK